MVTHKFEDEIYWVEAIDWDLVIWEILTFTVMA
jgi:hypothetical protein